MKKKKKKRRNTNVTRKTNKKSNPVTLSDLFRQSFSYFTAYLLFLFLYAIPSVYLRFQFHGRFLPVTIKYISTLSVWKLTLQLAFFDWQFDYIWLIFTI